MKSTEIEAINALYADDWDVYREASSDAVEQTLTVLRHGGLASAMCYTGTDPKWEEVDGLLVLRPNIKDEVYAVVYVNYSDWYVIDYVRINGSNAELISHTPDIFLGDLKGFYERIYDDYIMNEQGGFIEL